MQFAAVSVAPEQPAWTARAGTGGTIEIAFASGVQLRITGAVDPATLTAAVAALSGGRRVRAYRDLARLQNSPRKRAG